MSLVAISTDKVKPTLGLAPLNVAFLTGSVPRLTALRRRGYPARCRAHSISELRRKFATLRQQQSAATYV